MSDVERLDVPGVAGRAAARPKRVSIYQRFLRDPDFLPKYYAASLAVLLASCGLLVALGRLAAFEMPALWLASLVLLVLPNFLLMFVAFGGALALLLVTQPALPSPWVLLLVPAGIVCGTMAAAVAHNAAHGTCRPRALNNLWGEFAGLLQLTGFRAWAVTHILHHASPDHPERDAHPPGHLGFLAYVNGMNVQAKANYMQKHFEVFGKTPQAERRFALLLPLLPLLRYLRALLLMLVLGPVGFALFYLPLYIADTTMFMDVNHRTHRPTADGGFEVLNLNHNAWFRLLNAISFGSYFHKNHHRNPHVFDPRKLRQTTDAPYVTWHPAREAGRARG